MKFSTITHALTLATSALGAPSLAVKRNPTGSFDIIAYGIEGSYIKLFYSDGSSAQQRCPSSFDLI